VRASAPLLASHLRKRSWCAFTKIVKRLTKQVIDSKAFLLKLFRAIRGVRSLTQLDSERTKRLLNRSAVSEYCNGSKSHYCCERPELSHRVLETSFIWISQNSSRYLLKKARLSIAAHFSAYPSKIWHSHCISRLSKSTISCEVWLIHQRTSDPKAVRKSDAKHCLTLRLPGGRPSHGSR
jgi:hypothetical protein